MQWRKSQGRGGRVPPEVLHQGIFADLLRKERQGKRANGEQKEEHCKREGGNLKADPGKKYESMKMGRGTFFFFCFLLFETEICFGSTKMENFYREKACHASRKKLGKVTLPPLKNILLTPL